ncbi:hypothetical protein EIN_373730 [Entamoeba invadens IP1]|uniref:Uncharacterized protein n=1 Tax=Entamoeba invadens IP1 TaxID=370355 RepID=A0A0A1TVU3_ENTIV|nr:hypothetical protein EIN_373730 [Entamoeba invadens IP1]ELP83398.1 hypothetical protein EIN_373730 [Entamoeba invadens IP1]|eukprot:XP_004182744.1 hypothetical protein EIN_373730 [Entamoeba invadens IP1]
MAIQFAHQLNGLVQQTIEVAPNLMFFGFVVDQRTQFAQFFSTSKFSILLNKELLQNLVMISLSNTIEPSTIPEATACYRKGSFPLSTSFEEPKETILPTPTPQQLHDTLQKQIFEKSSPSSDRQQFNSFPQTPHQVTPMFMEGSELFKERIQSMPQPMTNARLGEPRKKRCTTPNRMVSYQSVKETIDDSTKLKIMSAISPEAFI